MTMLSTALILGITNWCLIYIAIGIYLMIFFLMFKLGRELRDIGLLLTAHTCASAFMVCATSCVMVGSNLFSAFLLRDMRFCIAWGTLYDMFECSIYYSYCLQGIFRLCRIVFYKKKYLLSFSLYVILIISQWILILILLLPPVFVNWYVQLPTEQFCLVPYTYIGPEIYHILLLYLIPLICLATVYIWITRYMRSVSRAPASRITTAQRVRNQRDFTVIKRILMLISILIVLRFPTIIFSIYAAVTKSLYPFTYGIVGLITSSCLIFIGIITIHITSPLRKRFLNMFLGANNRVQTGSIPLNQINMEGGGVRDIASITQRIRATDTSTIKCYSCYEESCPKPWNPKHVDQVSSISGWCLTYSGDNQTDDSIYARNWALPGSCTEKKCQWRTENSFYSCCCNTNLCNGYEELIGSIRLVFIGYLMIYIMQKI